MVLVQLEKLQKIVMRKVPIGGKTCYTFLMNAINRGESL
jgi:hypothetical protein